MRLINRILNKFKKPYEYLYFYVIDTDMFTNDKYDYKTQLYQAIQADAKKSNKVIVSLDFFTDKHSFESVIIFTTSEIKEKIYHPALYEIYAFLKKGRDASVFSYEFKEIIEVIKYNNTSKEKIFFKEINKEVIIFKFKILC